MLIKFKLIQEGLIIKNKYVLLFKKDFLKAIYYFSVLLIVPCSTAAEVDNSGLIRIPLRGNAVDIHFMNFSSGIVKVTPEYYKNSEKNIPSVNRRNLLFIPNSGQSKKKAGLPIEFILPAAVIFNRGNKKKLIGRKFIQSIIVYNNLQNFYSKSRQSNLPSYKKCFKNYGYNTNTNFATYSSFMWSNGTRTRDDGMFTFKNSMDEIRQLTYKISIELQDGRRLEFYIVFDALSNLTEKEKIINHKPGFLDISDDTAVLLYTLGGIAAFSAGPEVGAIYLLGDVAWGIAAIGTSIEDDKTYKKFTLGNRNYSWMSSPFDILIKINDYCIKDTEGKTIGIPEYNIPKSRLNYFLGTQNIPENMIVQISASAKGEIHIYIISGSIFKSKSSLSRILNEQENF